MMFSGARQPRRPASASSTTRFTRRPPVRWPLSRREPMRLCPRLRSDMSTPFISKDGRYVVAHDDGSAARRGRSRSSRSPGRIPAAQTTTCEQPLDFGFAAGKADFSFDGARVTFHISKHGISRRSSTAASGGPDDHRHRRGDLIGRRQGHDYAAKGPGAGDDVASPKGVGNYFPAFFPDGKCSTSPTACRRTRGTRSDSRCAWSILIVTCGSRISSRTRSAPGARGPSASCGARAAPPELQPFKPGEAPWAFMSLSKDQCAALVEARYAGEGATRSALLAACRATGTR